MATLEDILAASKVLAENSGNPNSGSCAKTEDNGNWVSDVKKDEGNAAVDTTKRAVEGETVVDSKSCFGKIEKEKTIVGNSGSLSSGGASESDSRVGVDGSSCVVLVRNEKIENREDSCSDNGQSRGGESSNLDVTERKSSFAEADGCEGGQVNGEELEDLEHRFHVGDFVWGKIKSHPWWPGQVYDPRDASDFALKCKQDGRLLVAFFGDGSCSWCLPSQLKPFVENFEEMSVGSTSKSFVNAVQRAVDEIGRLVESEMTCRCVPWEKRDDLARPLVTNAGIKEGVLVPDVDIRRLSVPEYEPTGILASISKLAKAVCVDNVFDFAVLRSQFSAFYRAKGVYPLPVYCEPFHIEGMEDKNKTVTQVPYDFSIPIEVPILGPLEDDWVSSPPCNSTKSQASSGDKIYHRRKQKSVAELMGENPNDKSRSQEETTTKEKKDVGKSASASSKKKKKSNDGEVEEGGTQSKRNDKPRSQEDLGTSTSSKKKKKKKSNDGEVEEVGTQSKNNGKPRSQGGTAIKEWKDVGKSESSSKKRKKKSSNNGEVEEGGTQSKSNDKPRSQGETTIKEKKDVGKSASSKKKKKKNSNNGEVEEGGNQLKSKDKPRSQETTIGEREDVVKSTSSKKKKNSNDREAEEGGTQGNSSTGRFGRKRKVEVSESPKIATKKVSDIDNSGSGEGGVSKGTSSSGKLKNIEVVATENTSGETKEDNEMVSTPRERKKSKYLCPPYTTPGWRTGNSSFKMGTVSDKIPKADNAGEHDEAEAPEDPCGSTSFSNFVDKSSDEKVTDGHQEELDASIKESPETTENNLKLTFAASDVSLPVDELLSDVQSAALDPFYLSDEGCLDTVWSFVSALRSSIYLHGPSYKVFQKCKTGSKRKTHTFEQGNQGNDLSHKKVKPAETRKPESKSKKATETLAGDASTLQKSSGGSKSHASHPKVTSRKRASEKPDSSGPPSDDLLSDVRVIRQKLDIMTAILENYHSKFSAEDKPDLRNEMKNLLENVETASEKVRVLAEKSPA